MTPLCDLAMKYSTDKCPHHRGLRPGHSYTPYYHELLKGISIQHQRLLEIGVETGSSLRMWRDYFSTSRIIGLDVNRSYLFHEERISTHLCDVSDPVVLSGITWYYRAFDIIIDDGSHQLKDQVAAALTILPYVSGFYVIEDVHESNVAALQEQFPKGEIVTFRKDFPSRDDRIMVIRL